MLGAAISLLIIGGMSSFGAETQKPSGTALLSLLSFFAGFSTNLIWHVFDHRIRKLLGEAEKNSEKAVLEASDEDLLDIKVSGSYHRPLKKRDRSISPAAQTRPAND